MTTIDGKVDQWDFDAVIAFEPGNESGLEPMVDLYDLQAADLEDAKGSAIAQFRERQGYQPDLVRTDYNHPGNPHARAEFADGSYLNVKVQSRLL